LVWGGSLNQKGSDYIRKLREVEKVIQFLESIKEELNSEKQIILSKTIDIITDYITKISEKRK